MNRIEQMFREKLFERQDIQYRDFQIRLVPGTDADSIIGVRVPEARKLAKELSLLPESNEFLKMLPHKYYDENNLHAFLLELIKDYDEVIRALDAFLPYVDNWATCDSMSPKVFRKHLPELYAKIPQWLCSEHTYTVRFGIEMLMSFYLDDAFTPEVLELVAEVSSDEYYVKMMVAWFFATALAKQYDASLPYIKENKLDKWTHNKAIQKSVESNRISPENKAFLRTLKLK